MLKRAFGAPEEEGSFLIGGYFGAVGKQPQVSMKMALLMQVFCPHMVTLFGICRVI